MTQVVEKLEAVRKTSGVDLIITIMTMKSKAPATVVSGVRQITMITKAARLEKVSETVGADIIIMAQTRMTKNKS